MIVLDASVLIAHLDRSDARHERATELLLDLADCQLGASPLTLAEVLVGPARVGRTEVAVELLDELGLDPVSLDRASSLRLAQLRASTGLRLPDCCVLLAAQTSAATVATFDRRLAAAAVEAGVEIIGFAT